MGWGKKLRKAVKHVTKPVRKIVKPVEKAVKEVGKVVEKAGQAVASPLRPKIPQAAPTPAPVVEQAPTPAQLVDVPDKEDVQTDDEAQTESGRKKARAGGKKSLSVARSSGGGLNI